MSAWKLDTLDDRGKHTVKPISQIKSGTNIKVHYLDCGQSLKRRLTSFGIYDGGKAKVVKNDKHGPIILKIFGSKVALGRGQADKIQAEEIEEINK